MKGLLFNSAQSSFLAGYLAAGMSESGKVATFGGLAIPSVTSFMDGYWEVCSTTTRRTAPTSRSSVGTRTNLPPDRSPVVSKTRRKASNWPRTSSSRCGHHFPGGRTSWPGCNQGSTDDR